MLRDKRLIIALACILTIVLLVLISSRAWAALIGLFVLVDLIGLGVYLRRRGIWGGPRHSGQRKWWIAAAVGLALLILALTLGVRLYTDWLWFDHLGYGQVFRTQLLTRLLLFLAVSVISSLFLGISWQVAVRGTSGRKGKADERTTTLPTRGSILPSLLWILAGVAGFIFGQAAQGKWMRVLRFLYGAEVGIHDPLFRRDLGFYLFRLRLLVDLRNALLWLTGIALVGTGLIYLLGLRRRGFPPRVLAHLSLLGVLFLLVKAWDYRLKIYQLLYSRHGAAFGAGYTDVHARWPAYAILTWIVLGCAVLLLVNLWRRRWRLLVAAGATWLICLLVLGAIYPALVQAFRVRPSELAMERP
ncbi:MAG: UPF0182 family protein, partial [Chloroflexia bacterium]